MNKFIPAAVLSTLATFAVIPYSLRAAEAVGVDAPATAATASAPVKVAVGRMVYDPAGKTIATIYSVSSKGSPIVMLDGKLLTVPVATLTMVKNKLTTSLTAKELAKR